MGYTALRDMREINRERFGKDVGPFEPALWCNEKKPNDLKSAALRFLHVRCEGLRFSPDKSREERAKHQCEGTSYTADQIPYNMQMDLDRLCLERELETFIDSGAAADAYTVYYCFLEMFVGRYGRSHNMVEMLSEFESNASSLLMKHRDHYSHSVYVFALGLAIYDTNEAYRTVFRAFYREQLTARWEARRKVEGSEGIFLTEAEESAAKEAMAAGFFLEYWGITSLFHDIGYPFEIPFEQVMSYFEVDRKKRSKCGICLSYDDVSSLTLLEEPAHKKLRELYHRDFANTDELLAFDITEKLGTAYGFSEEYMLGKISSKPRSPENFGYYMDHAYFSAARLYQELYEVLGAGAFTKTHIDALSAILLHNSLFKFAISFYKADDPKDRKAPLRAELHPLAYMLMLCDELQCWDRTAYGRNSRSELHPMSAEFDFSNSSIHAVYNYDKAESGKIEDYRRKYRKWEKKVRRAGKKAAGDAPQLRAYSDMASGKQEFTRDIESIVDTSIIPLSVKPDAQTVDRSVKHTYLSDSNFLHLYDFAVVLNGRYHYQGREDDIETVILEADFNRMSLEYKLNNIHQARRFDRHLDLINCFYTDKPVDYDMVEEFTQEEINAFAPKEHESWVREHLSMGWTKGTDYLDAPAEDPSRYWLAKDLTRDEVHSALREQMREHKLLMSGELTAEALQTHYDQLPENEKGKDWEPFESMLKLVRKYDGLRLYRLR